MQPVGGAQPQGGAAAGVGGTGGSAGRGGAAGGEAGGSGAAAGSGGTFIPPTDGGVDAASDGGSDAGTEPEPQDLPQALRDAGVVALYPAPGATGQCPDPALRVVFSSPPTLGSSGTVQVFDSASPSTPVASIDLAVATTNVTIDGATYSSERAAYVEGNELIVYPQPRMLNRGHSYFVKVETAALTLDDATSWTFATAANGPSSTSTLHVTSDGSGDYCTLQGALDAVGSGHATIELGRGTYHGIVHFKNKAQLTIRGADRKATVLAGTNNENMNGGTAKRALIGVDSSTEITFENLTIHNRTPQGGSQAEALRMQSCDRCIVRDADIISLQDTLLWSGRIYAESCYIAGNVDFIWGTGAAYFKDCEIKTLGRKGYNVQARNGAGGYGYVFVDSRLTSDPGITGNWLGRVDASVYPASHVAYVNCELGSHIDPAGWQVTGFGTGSLRFWEYQSRSPSGALVDVSNRLPASKQLSSAEAAQMRDPAVVLDGWTP